MIKTDELKQTLVDNKNQELNNNAKCINLAKTNIISPLIQDEECSLKIKMWKLALKLKFTVS